VTTLLLCGDVMIGRGVDQVMAQSADPQLFEPYVDSAERYVELAIAANGPIPRPVDADYVWGVALEMIEEIAPDVRIVNLETAVTTSAQRWPGKPVLYRAHPNNVAVLGAARIDCCVLANNHALDWGERGLLETLDCLHDAGLATAGAGRHRFEAQAPAILDLGARRVIVIAFASTNSGAPLEWTARSDRPGLDVIDDWSLETAGAIAARLADIRRSDDIVVASVHWGSNWGYEVPDAQRRLAHELVDLAHVDVVHGHSSHHPRAIEQYKGRLILYGCGDFITDYEGVGRHEQYRHDLVLAYIATLDATTGGTIGLTMNPFQLRRFQLARPSESDTDWLADNLDRQSRRFGVRVQRSANGTLVAHPG
jgi:poly-gamma-glutamate capsule biosynthesis protein CapA/YwtB (metallophosphatase superfamily)